MPHIAYYRNCTWIGAVWFCAAQASAAVVAALHTNAAVLACMHTINVNDCPGLVYAKKPP